MLTYLITYRLVWCYALNKDDLGAGIMVYLGGLVAVMDIFLLYSIYRWIF